MEQGRLPWLCALALTSFLLKVHTCDAGMITTPAPGIPDKSALSTATTPEQCTCMFRTPPVVVCTQYDADYLATLNRVQDKLANLTSLLGFYQDQWNGADDLIESIDRKMSRLTSVCLKAEGRLVNMDNDGINLVEISKHLVSLERMMSDVKYDESYGDLMLDIDYKLGNLTKQLDKLASDAINDQRDEWTEEKAVLQAELGECQHQEPESERMVTVTQWPQTKLQDICAKPSRILQPYTIRQAERSKTWFSDPVMDEDVIWLGPYDVTICTLSSSYDCRRYGNSYTKSVSAVHKYNTTSMFAESSDDYVPYYLPHRVEHSAIVAHIGYLYYVQYNVKKLFKFDIAANTTADSKNLPFEIGVATTYPYTSGGFSSLDLEVDESGLWMVYSTTSNHGMIVLSRINSTTLEFENTWYGNFPKKYLGNCFMMCETLFCISSHDSRNAKVNYFYDTKTDTEGFMNVPFESIFGNIQSLNFDPNDQKLHAIDDGHVVVYDVVFE